MINHQYIGKSKSEIYLCSYIVNEESPNVLIVPPLGWYCIGPNRIFSRLSGLLNNIEVNVFIFDYLGQGESHKLCKDISLYDLEYSFNTVLEYIQGMGRDIFCLGYGIGNHFLSNMEENSLIKGIIFYTPDYMHPYTFTDVFVENEIIEARENGYFIVKQDKTNKHKFWKSIVGGFQDVLYNPISYDIVSNFKNIAIKDKLSTIKVPLFIISDQEIFNDINNVTVKYFSELENCILPSDWEENVWPFVLDDINTYIVQWIDMQIKKNKTTDRSYQGVNLQYNTNTFSDLFDENGNKRILFSYSSLDQENLGVIHLPSNVSQKVPCIIFVTGLGGDKLECHMCGPRLGEYLAEKGLAFVRYDSRFSGTSTRCLSECTISGLKEDFSSVIQYLYNYKDLINVNEVIVISWSEGAKIALLNFENLKGSCFWNPVLVENEIDGTKAIDFQSSLRSFVRHKVTRKKVKSIHTAGELFGLDYILDNRKVNYLNLLEHMSQSIKVVWSKSEITSTNYELLKKYKLNETIVDADHHLFNYEVMETIFEITFKWIKDILKL